MRNTQTLDPLGALTQPSLLLVFFGLLIAVLAEAERLPFDNPATHLELTMTERAIPIEYEGRQYAIVELAEGLKKVLLLTLLIDLFTPHFLTPLALEVSALLSPLIYLIKLGISILVLGIWELTQGQLRLREPIWSATVTSSLALGSIALTFITRLLV